jgi:tetratricopeptide (TPR) repeat protein
VAQETDPTPTPPNVDLAALLGGIASPAASEPVPDANRVAEQLLPLLVPVLRQELERSVRQALGNVFRRLAENIETGVSPLPEMVAACPPPAPPPPLAPPVPAVADAPPAEATLTEPGHFKPPNENVRTACRRAGLLTGHRLRTGLRRTDPPATLPADAQTSAAPAPVAPPTLSFPAPVGSSPAPRETERAVPRRTSLFTSRRKTALRTGDTTPPADTPPRPAVSAEPPAVDAPPRTLQLPHDDYVDLGASYAAEPPVRGFDPPRRASPQTALDINLAEEETASPSRPSKETVRASRQQKAASHLRRGNMLLERGRLDDAITEYTRALEFLPGLALAYLNRSLAHARKAEYSHAADDADRALQLDGNLKNAYFVRATARAGLGAHEMALADLSHLIHIDPKNVLALNERGLIHAGRRDYERAILDYSSALAIAPKFMLARFNRGIAYRSKGDLSAALDDLKLVIERNARSAPAYYQRALVHFVRTDLTASAEDLSRALEIEPEHSEAAALLIQVQQRQETEAPALPDASIDADGGAPAEEASSAVAEPTPEVSVPTPAPREATPPSRPAAAAQHIRMTCPECGAPGQVRSDRLNRILQCRRCWKMFRVNNDGVMVEFVPPNLRPGRWTAIRKRVRWLLPLAASILILIGVTAVMMRPARAPALPPLPTELEARAQVLAEAWMRRDGFTMRRLTLPTHDRVLNAWAAYHKPPAAPSGEAEAPSIDVRVVRNSNDQAQLVVAVNSLEDGHKVELTQTWHSRGDAWYFVPSLPTSERKAELLSRQKKSLKTR